MCTWIGPDLEIRVEKKMDRAPRDSTFPFHNDKSSNLIISIFNDAGSDGADYDDLSCKLR